jgi:hypothetical protein
MENKSYKTLSVAGTLYIPGTDMSYFLLNPRPVRKDDWMSDDMNIFYVAHDKGKARHVIVKGAFLIDYALAGHEISVDEMQEALQAFDFSELFDTAHA